MRLLTHTPRLSYLLPICVLASAAAGQAAPSGDTPTSQMDLPSAATPASTESTSATTATTTPSVQELREAVDPLREADAQKAELEAAEAMTLAPKVFEDPRLSLKYPDPDNVPPVLEPLMQLRNNPEGPDWRERIDAAVAELDPEGIEFWCEYLDTHGRSPGTEEIWTSMMVRYAQIDGPRAWNFAMWQGSARHAFVDMLEAWVESDSNEAVLSFLEATPHSYDRSYGAKILSGVHLRRGDVEGQRLVEQFKHPELRRWGARHVAGTLMLRPDGPRLELTREWLQEHQDDDTFDLAFGRFSSIWAETDPYAAADWALDLPEGENQARAVSEALLFLATEDPRAAADWMASKPRSTRLDPAIEGFAKTFARHDPVASLEWAQLITDDDRRARVLQIVVDKSLDNAAKPSR